MWPSSYIQLLDSAPTYFEDNHQTYTRINMTERIVSMQEPQVYREPLIEWLFYAVSRKDFSC